MSSISFSPSLAAAALALGLLSGPVQAAEETANKPAENKAAEPGPAAATDGTAELKKTVGELQGDVKKLKGLKFSGFIQARYDHEQGSASGVTSDGKTLANKNQFGIRRGRLKATWQGTPYSEAVLQVDATGKGLSLIDAEVSLLSPWKPIENKLKLTMGQTKVPFGFEIAQSSWERELPERSQVVNKLFPGVRDRGVKLTASIGPIRGALAVFNGNGLDDTSTTYDYVTDKDGDGVISEDEAAAIKTSSALNFGNADRDMKKDFTGRVGVDLGYLVGGVNAYVGQWGKIPTLTATTNPDTGVTTYDSGTEEGVEYLAKTRFGVDLQLNLDLAKSLGKSIVRAEVIKGHGLYTGSTQSDTDVQGWYGTVVQNLGPKFAVAARVEAFDPDLATEQDDTRIIEPALLYFPTQAVRITASYQLVSDYSAKDDAGNKIDKENNHFTLQLQGKF